MTPERLKQLRTLIKSGDCTTLEVEMLTHLESLQSEVERLKEETKEALRVSSDLHSGYFQRGVENSRLREVLKSAVKSHDAYCECGGCRVVYDEHSFKASDAELPESESKSDNSEGP